MAARQISGRRHVFILPAGSGDPFMRDIMFRIYSMKCAYLAFCSYYFTHQVGFIHLDFFKVLDEVFFFDIVTFTYIIW